MNYTILGAGKSGVAAALLANRLGHRVFVSEYKPETAYSQAAAQLREAGIECEFGGHTIRALECDCIITSPGIKPSSQIILDAEAASIPVISELEFASQHCRNPIIAITGTNGKTTTTALIEHIFNSSGRSAIACGNIGIPLSAIVLDLAPDTIVVAETSSYQLDRIETFHPRVAIILNITPDHLEYHGSVDKYAEAKWKISKNMTSDDVLVLCADNALAARAAWHTNAQVSWFSAESNFQSALSNLPTQIQSKQQGMYLHEGNLVFWENNHKEEEEVLMRVEELRLPGIHNAYNSMAAALSARAFELRNEDIRDSLMSFSGVEHRLESVRVLDTLEYVNDSKATNVNATWYALQSFHKPITLIAGGRGDSNDYSLLNDAVHDHVRLIIAIGEEQDAIFNHFCSITRCVRALSLEEAVDTARKESEEQSVVLFSPACKSFDMFMNFEHRGQVFKDIVASLV